MNTGSLLGIVLKQPRNSELVGFIDSYLKMDWGSTSFLFLFLFVLIEFVSLKSFITAQTHLKLIFLEDLKLESTGLLMFLCYVIKDWALNSRGQRGKGVVYQTQEGEREISHCGN